MTKDERIAYQREHEGLLVLPVSDTQVICLRPPTPALLASCGFVPTDLFALVDEELKKREPRESEGKDPTPEEIAAARESFRDLFNLLRVEGDDVKFFDPTSDGWVDLISRWIYGYFEVPNQADLALFARKHLELMALNGVEPPSRQIGIHGSVTGWALDLAALRFRDDYRSKALVISAQASMLQGM